MINNFVKVSLQDPSKGEIKETFQTRNSIVLDYPCTNSHVCTPYVLDLSKGVYKFECWGSLGQQWVSMSTPGLGAYTSGILYVPKPTKFFVYIGNTGFFNAVKEMESSVRGCYPGGATDVRLNYSEKWWDNYSLISRIMVAAGGGGAEWQASIGGNGGTINGGESISATETLGPNVHDEHCPGAQQTSGSECPTFSTSYNGGMIQCVAVSGSFGYARKMNPISMNDYGAFGGGGYYGGTSYQYTYAASGGSSFISGHKGCDAVKNQYETIEHTGHPFHYSGFVFTNTKMISGNETMPLPNSIYEPGLHSGKGAFRITILLYHFQCTYRRSLYYSLLPNIFVLICSPIKTS